MHLPAHARHRRDRGSDREPAGVGAARRGVFSRPLRRRGAAGVRHRDWIASRALQPAGVAAHRRVGHRRRDRDVPLGHAAAVRHSRRQRLARGGLRGVGGGRAPRRVARPCRRRPACRTTRASRGAGTCLFERARHIECAGESAVSCDYSTAGSRQARSVPAGIGRGPTGAFAGNWSSGNRSSGNRSAGNRSSGNRSRRQPVFRQPVFRQPSRRPRRSKHPRRRSRAVPRRGRPSLWQTSNATWFSIDCRRTRGS